MPTCSYCKKAEAMRDLTVCFDCRHYGEHRLKILRDVGALPGGDAPNWYLVAAVALLILGAVFGTIFFVF